MSTLEQHTMASTSLSRAATFLWSMQARFKESNIENASRHQQHSVSRDYLILMNPLSNPRHNSVCNHKTTNTSEHAALWLHLQLGWPWEAGLNIQWCLGPFKEEDGHVSGCKVSMSLPQQAPPIGLELWWNGAQVFILSYPITAQMCNWTQGRADAQ